MAFSTVSFCFQVMARYTSWLQLLVTVLSSLCLLPLATTQAIDEDKVDFTLIPGYTNLRGCVRGCFGECNVGCTGPDGDLGCLTNQCLCRPSSLYAGIQYVVGCTRKGCQNLDDVQLANDSLAAYCRLKGYTRIETPKLLPTSAAITDGGIETGGFYTDVVFETTTVYRSDATKRAEAVLAVLSRIAMEKQDMTDVDCILGTTSLGMLLLTSIFVLSSLAYALRT